MIFNAFMPHLAATILLRRYAPGLIAGLALLVPINSTILIQAMTTGELSWWGFVISTIVVAGLLLTLLPVFFRLSKLMIK